MCGGEGSMHSTQKGMECDYSPQASELDGQRSASRRTKAGPTCDSLWLLDIFGFVSSVPENQKVWAVDIASTGMV